MVARIFHCLRIRDPTVDLYIFVLLMTKDVGWEDVGGVSIAEYLLTKWVTSTGIVLEEESLVVEEVAEPFASRNL